VPRRAFTLIELLVVIAIIALLTGILLPAIGSARNTAKTVICKQRSRELALATGFYANDHQGRIWPIVLQNNQQRYTWARIWNAAENRFEPGPIFEYLDNATEVLACPTNGRRTLTGASNSDLFDFQNNELDFDFTMIAGTQGARASLERTLYYIDRLKDGAPTNAGSNRYPRELGRPFMTAFRKLPVFVEESLPWYNGTIPDGLWGNNDQFTARHDGMGHYTMIDGTVGEMRDVSGASEDLAEFGQDLLAREIYALLPPRSGNAGIQYRSLYNMQDVGSGHGYVDRAGW
jgi:prepilin-type N-terminal cleavage/methylation domain-containing protein